MKYKHIVFDIDGTLIDTEYAVLHSLQETIKGLSGREIPCSELRFALGITGTDFPQLPFKKLDGIEEENIEHKDGLQEPKGRNNNVRQTERLYPSEETHCHEYP